VVDWVKLKRKLLINFSGFTDNCVVFM